MNLVAPSIISRFTGDLKTILELELNAGNRIVETYENKDGSVFPVPDAIMIFLESPFKTAIRKDLTDIEYRDIDDPHWWKAEYFDKKHALFLCC